MRTRTFVALVVAGLGPGQSAQAQGWCDWVFEGDKHDGKPECFSGPGFKDSEGLPRIVFKRETNICDTSTESERIHVDMVYPDPALMSATTKLTPIVFVHGGGTANSFCDKHTSDTTFPYDCPHPANPYAELAERLAQKGAVVMFPILNIGPGTKPTDDSVKVLNAVNCLANRTSHAVGPGGCGEVGEVGCWTDLFDHLAWTPNDKSRMVYIGHSSGGVVGLYMPQRLGSALSAVIMIDPAKADYLESPPTALSTTSTPFVHIYPDWYGPFQNPANELFALGGSIAGPWVPIGIRDRATSAPGAPSPSCDPDAGCHTAHHCTALDDTYSHLSLYDEAGHGNYCSTDAGSCTGMQASADCRECVGGPSGNPNLGKTCDSEATCTSCSPASACAGSTCSNPTECGRESNCRHRQAPAGSAWQVGDSDWFLNRYVVAYASCFGASYGTYYQSWVNGKDRELDDDGSNGHLCVGPNGQPDAVCAGYSEGTCVGGERNGLPCIDRYGCGPIWEAADCAGGGKDVCRAAGCHWAQGEDGRTIRVNNGEMATEYDANATRQYTANQGYSSSGTCVGGINHGMACTTDSFCGKAANCTAGDFQERAELLNADPLHARGIQCVSGPQ